MNSLSLYLGNSSSIDRLGNSHSWTYPSIIHGELLAIDRFYGTYFRLSPQGHPRQ